MAEKDKTENNSKTSVGSVDNKGKQDNVAGTVHGNQIGTIIQNQKVYIIEQHSSCTTDVEQEQEQDSKDAKALRLVDIQLSDYRITVPKEELEQAIKSASAKTQEAIFYRARTLRKEVDEKKRQLKRENNQDNEKEQKIVSLSKKIERTIPIFQALTESEYGKDKHQYFANLGYALKDQSSPDWKKALHALEQAISLSMLEEQGPSAHYYFNKAVCMIKNEDTRKDIEDIKDAIKESSKFYPLRSSMLSGGVGYELLKDWLYENNLNLRQIVDTAQSGSHQQGYANQTNYDAPNQNLAQAAAEIQQLLEQLSQTYPTTTTTEQMVVATKAIEQIESDPTWKQRAVNALKQGTLSTLETNPVGAFVVGAIKGWQNSE